VKPRGRPSPGAVIERQKRDVKPSRAVIPPKPKYNTTYEQEYYRQTQKRGTLRQQMAVNKPASEMKFRDDKIMAREYGTKLRAQDGKRCKQRPTDNRSKGGNARPYIPWCVRRV